MARLVGSYLGVRYNVGGQPLFHIRFIAGSVDEALYPFDLVTRSPDGDSMEEALSDQRSVSEVKVASNHKDIDGVPEDQIYPFRAEPTAAEITAWKRVGDDIVAGRVPGRLRPDRRGQPQGRGHADLADALGLNAQGAPAAPGQPVQVQVSVKLSHDFTAGVLQWILAEASGDLLYGMRVSCSAPLVKGKKIVHELRGHGEVFLRCLSGEDVKNFLLLPAEWDARILPTVTNLVGAPERSLHSATATSREEPVHWQMAGNVRTAPWCMAYLATENLGFEGHHEKLRSLAGIDGGAWGIPEHYQTMMTLKMAIQIDQLDGANCAVVENLFRRAQTIEFGWAERIRERENKSSSAGSRLSLEEQSVFGGLTRVAANLMICPQLVDYVRDKVEKEAKLQKALRQAREERDGHGRAGAKAKGKKNKKDDE